MSDELAELDLSHLNPDVAEIARLDAEARIRFIYRDRFIPHGKAEDILNELEFLYRMEDAVRAQGRLLVGESLMGKSTILDEFSRNHRASDNPDGEGVICPVISVQYPETAREGIYPEILRKMNALVPAKTKSTKLRGDCVDLLKAVGCRILIIDEFHNLLGGSDRDRANGLNSIKYLMNELRRPIVVAGTADCRVAIRSDPQMTSRLKYMPLPRFRNDESFQLLLGGFEAMLPLRKPSNLFEPMLAEHIFRLTEGVTGHVSDLLNMAAKIAIEDGEEKITSKVLDDTGWLATNDKESLERLL